MKIIDEIYGRTSLAYAIIHEDVNDALQLIKICDDINQVDKRKYSYLHFAAQMELPEVVDALIQKGADVNAKTISGGTPLRIAIVRCSAYETWRSVKVVKSLLDHGANVNDVVNGITIQELAIDSKVPEIKELIVT